MSKSDSDTTSLPARLRAMAAEWDDPMCSENPVRPLLLEAAAEIEIHQMRDAHSKKIAAALGRMKELHRGS